MLVSTTGCRSPYANTATAREVTRKGRSGIYDVTVSVEGRMIAEFRGLSRATGGAFVEGAGKKD